MVLKSLQQFSPQVNDHIHLYLRQLHCCLNSWSEDFSDNGKTDIARHTSTSEIVEQLALLSEEISDDSD